MQHREHTRQNTSNIHRSNVQQSALRGEKKTTVRPADIETVLCALGIPMAEFEKAEELVGAHMIQQSAQP
jgi:hypothetical protein